MAFIVIYMIIYSDAGLHIKITGNSFWVSVRCINFLQW